MRHVAAVETGSPQLHRLRCLEEENGAMFGAADIVQKKQQFPDEAIVADGVDNRMKRAWLAARQILRVDDAHASLSALAFPSPVIAQGASYAR